MATCGAVRTVVVYRNGRRLSAFLGTVMSNRQKIVVLVMAAALALTLTFPITAGRSVGEWRFAFVGGVATPGILWPAHISIIAAEVAVAAGAFLIAGMRRQGSPE